MRTQSKDPTIQEAALQGVRLWKIGGGYFGESAEAMAKRVGVTPAFIRQACAIRHAGLGDAVLVGELTHTKAYRLARIINVMGNDTATDSDTHCGVSDGE